MPSEIPLARKSGYMLLLAVAVCSFGAGRLLDGDCIKQRAKVMP